MCSIVFRKPLSCDPSVIFGPEDGFFNKFASLARFLPALPLIGGGHTRFQPVYVADVAAAICTAIDGKAQTGTVYELGGPQIKTFRQLMEMMLHEIRRKRVLVPVPFFMAKIIAAFLQLLPQPLLTMDQVELLKRDNTVSPEALREHRTLDGLGITPTAMGGILPTYLWPYRVGGEFAHRPPEPLSSGEGQA